jgi:hypothetical protein
MQPVRWLIAGIIFCVYVFVLPGCSEIWYESPVRVLPDEVKAKLSIGDTREKVRSLLGDPLIDERNHGVEVYRQTGRDLDVVGLIPVPGKKTTVDVLVVYDEHDMVKDYKAGIVSGGVSSFRIGAGGFHLVNDGLRVYTTLLGPCISREELASMDVLDGSCSLVLVMSNCPMEQVTLDNKRLADLSPAGSSCLYGTHRHNYYGTFIRRNITPGNHRLKIHQETMVRDRDFETDFECENGETVYAELDAYPVQDWWGYRLEGDISISKSLTDSIVKIGALYPILWHRGTWYGSSTSPKVGQQ